MVNIRIEKTAEKTIKIEIEDHKLTFKEENVELHKSDCDETSFELRFYDETGHYLPYRILFTYGEIIGYIDRSDYDNKKDVFELEVPEELCQEIYTSLKKNATHIYSQPVDWDSDNGDCLEIEEIYSLTDAPVGVLYG